MVQIPRAGMIPEGHDYYVHVEKDSSSECWADSWSFSAGPVREGSGEWVGVPPEVRFTAPRGSDVIPEGGSITARWRLFPLTIPYLNFAVSIVDIASGNPVYGPMLWETTGLPFDNETRVYTANLAFSPGILAAPGPGRYRIRVLRAVGQESRRRSKARAMCSPSPLPGRKRRLSPPALFASSLPTWPRRATPST